VSTRPSPWAAPSRRLDLTLPAVGPVPIAQGVPVIGAVIALSRLTDVAAIAGGCRGGLGGRNEGGRSQRGDEQLHGSSHPVTDHRPSVRAAARGRLASACATEHVTGGAAAL
jgi:hypothetical protein